MSTEMKSENRRWTADPSQKSRQTLPLKRMLISQEKLTCPNALVQNLNNKLLAMP